METTNKFTERRQNFMETYKGDIILEKTIPEVAAQLMYDEFGINIYDHSHIPIVFTVGWTEILKYVSKQPGDEFSIDICGVQLEYVTEYSESDKSTNIVPQMRHKKAPIFMKQNHQMPIGASYNDELTAKYNAWRSVNLAETLSSLENSIFSIIRNEYGINLMVANVILPLMAAIYAAGLQVARETKQTINMYNIFEIDVLEDDKVILTPLATVKQWLKNDSKQQ